MPDERDGADRRNPAGETVIAPAFAPFHGLVRSGNITSSATNRTNPFAFALGLYYLCFDFEKHMRKTVLILLGVVLYLLLGAGGAIPADPILKPRAAIAGQLLAQHRAFDQYACQRICNSDLQVSAPARIAAPGAERVRGFDSSARALWQHGPGWPAAQPRQRGYANRIQHLFPAGARAADYYVYLLRRLLI